MESRDSQRRRLARGFTRIEVLVVVAVAAVLAVLISSGVVRAREAARRSQCADNLKQIGAALHSYHSAWNHFPPLLTAQTDWGWSAMILPELDQGPLFHELDRTRGSSYPSLKPAFGFSAHLSSLTAPNALATPLTVFRCPSDSGSVAANLTANVVFGTEASEQPFGRSNYPAVMGSDSEGWDGVSVNGPFPYYRINRENAVAGNTNTWYPPHGRTIKEFTDGTSITFFIGERTSAEIVEEMLSGGEGVWAGMVNYSDDVGGECNSKWPLNHKRLEFSTRNRDSSAFGSKHGSGANFLMVDGKVRFITQAINAKIYIDLADISDGHVVCGDP